MGVIKLYHGTDIDSAKDICLNQSVIIERGSKHTDFGQGFYLTEDRRRAVKWAKHKASVRDKRPAVVAVEFDLDNAKHYIKDFSDDIIWGRFIINNRNGKEYIEKVEYKDNNLDSRYSITHGRIADIDILDIARKLKNTGEMLQDIKGILNRDYPMQYAFHTREATSYLKNYTYEVL